MLVGMLKAVRDVEACQGCLETVQIELEREKCCSHFPKPTDAERFAEAEAEGDSEAKGCLKLKGH